jgi:hypothetical protein
MRITELGPVDGGGWLIESYILSKRARIDSPSSVKDTFNRWLVEEGMAVLQLSSSLEWQQAVMAEVGKQNSIGLETLYNSFTPALQQIKE